MQIIPMRDSPIGIGIVGPLTKTAFGCILEQGYTWAIVNAEEGSPVAIQTLQNAQSGGSCSTKTRPLFPLSCCCYTAL